MDILKSDYELYHHGIKGQKWGVRRYQNYDGSHTPEGRERECYRKRHERAAKRKTASYSKRMEKEHAETARNLRNYEAAYKNLKKAYKDEKYSDLIRNKEKMDKYEKIAGKHMSKYNSYIIKAHEKKLDFNESDLNFTKREKYKNDSNIVKKYMSRSGTNVMNKNRVGAASMLKSIESERK